MARHNLGGLYMKGQGRGENYKKAAKWYRKAAEQGHEEAKEALKRSKEKYRSKKTCSNKLVVFIDTLK